MRAGNQSKFQEAIPRFYGKRLGASHRGLTESSLVFITDFLGSGSSGYRVLPRLAHFDDRLKRLRARIARRDAKGVQVVSPHGSMDGENAFILSRNDSILQEITNEITVYVKGPPRISNPPLQYGMEGQEVNVECLIVSVPPTGKVRWEKDGQLLDIDNNQGIEMIKGERSKMQPIRRGGVEFP